MWVLFFLIWLFVVGDLICDFLLFDYYWNFIFCVIFTFVFFQAPFSDPPFQVAFLQVKLLSFNLIESFKDTFCLFYCIVFYRELFILKECFVQLYFCGSTPGKTLDENRRQLPNRYTKTKKKKMKRSAQIDKPVSLNILWIVKTRLGENVEFSAWINQHRRVSKKITTLVNSANGYFKHPGWKLTK